jgi:hypothetical protein
MTTTTATSGGLGFVRVVGTELSLILALFLEQAFCHVPNETDEREHGDEC